MSDSLVTIGMYWYLGDAITARNALDAAGIESFVDDENIVAVNWFNAVAVNGVKLRVRNVDALRAGEVLESECQSIEEIGEAHEEFIEPEVCVACGSPEIRRVPRVMITAGLSAALIAIAVAVGEWETMWFGVAAIIFFALIAGRWRCSECGEQWN